MWSNQFLLFDSENRNGRLVDMDTLDQVMEENPGLEIGQIHAGMIIWLIPNQRIGRCPGQMLNFKVTSYGICTPVGYINLEKENTWTVN